MLKYLNELLFILFVWVMIIFLLWDFEYEIVFKSDIDFFIFVL